MKIENNFSFVDIRKFVKSTLDVCIEDGVYSPTYYDYAIRCMYVTFFTDVDLSEMEAEDRISWLYGDEYQEFLENCGTKERCLLKMLDNACREEAAIIVQRNLIDYKEQKYPDGLSRIAESMETTSKTIGDVFNEQSLLNIAKKTFEENQQPKKRPRRPKKQ